MPLKYNNVHLAHTKDTGHTKMILEKRFALCFGGEHTNFAFYFLSTIILCTMALHMSTCFVCFGTMERMKVPPQFQIIINHYNFFGELKHLEFEQNYRKNYKDL